MSSQFRPATDADEAPLIDFLARVFSAGRDAPFLNPALLRWKYWLPREGDSQPRSYLIERDGRIVAHAGLWPVTVSSAGATERGVHMIDWASDAGAPGAGVSLLQRLTAMFDFVLAIGGTDMTQSILPKFGFQTVGEASTWARPLRPWRQALAHQYKDWRLPIRAARNLQWAMSPPPVAMRGWSASPGDVSDAVGMEPAAPERDGAFFRYFKECPAVPCLTFQIRHEGLRAGYFALALAHLQARLAGLWLHNESPANRRIAFQLAQDAALRHSGACEIVYRGTAELSAEAAAGAGLRLRGTCPVFLYRKRKDAGPLPLQFQLLDNDNFFLVDRKPNFLT